MLHEINNRLNFDILDILMATFSFSLNINTIYWNNSQSTLSVTLYEAWWPCTRSEATHVLDNIAYPPCLCMQPLTYFWSTLGCFSVCVNVFLATTDYNYKTFDHPKHIFYRIDYHILLTISPFLSRIHSPDWNINGHSFSNISPMSSS